mmetsp:Transcript_24074/g.37145  ORF Transcript_24074/g.37145 Transcript_24074/m.37145 type:complete len:737 (+) Transcript_24074:146-2356(+)
MITGRLAVAEASKRIHRDKSLLRLFIGDNTHCRRHCHQEVLQHRYRSSMHLRPSSITAQLIFYSTAYFPLFFRTTSALNMSTVSGDNAVRLESFRKHWNFSWIDQLTEERDTKSPDQNRVSRPVKNGHYVLVDPTPLRKPRLVLHSRDMASMLKLTDDDVASEEFLNYFSGNVSWIEDSKTWATPYALSIMGTRYVSNCPFGTGDGYGDGRAISIGEVLIPDDADTESNSHIRLEMQLKGAGPTPFCRGADGRAVLRSSIREFLASEAMHHLRVPTTRAISLIVSEGGDTSDRPWYREQSDSSVKPTLPEIDDPRLAVYPLEKRKKILEQLARQKRDPDVMIQEPNAITCRVSPSFMRIGHIDLFARRAEKAKDKDGKFDKSSPEWQELADIIWHAAFREFHDEAYAPHKKSDDLKSCIVAMLEKSGEQIAVLVAEWIRVGFAQGNFNADNCLVGGRTMDYGPFGYMDQYDPFFAKWTGSGEHFGFLRQPTAGFVNFAVLVESALQALKEEEGDKEIEKLQEDILGKTQEVFQQKMNQIWGRKLGFHPEDTTSAIPGALWQDLEPLLRESKADWTLFWRQLSLVAAEFPMEDDSPSTDYSSMLMVLEGSEEVRKGSSPFYETLSSDTREKFMKWIEKWRDGLKTSVSKQEFLSAMTSGVPMSVADRMRLENPKYTLREWILVEAYTKAAAGDESIVNDLMTLIENPYDEGSSAFEEKYYRRAPDEALGEGGTAFMS